MSNIPTSLRCSNYHNYQRIQNLLSHIIRANYFDETSKFARVYLSDFFCSGIQLYRERTKKERHLLLRPYLCFISFLYIELYVLGDDALII